MQSMLWHRVAHFISDLSPSSHGDESSTRPRHTRLSRSPPPRAHLDKGGNNVEQSIPTGQFNLSHSNLDERSCQHNYACGGDQSWRDDLPCTGDDVSRDDVPWRDRCLHLEQSNLLLQHRVTRLGRMLAVAEEQRGVALARLAGFTGGIEGVHEQNRVLQRTITSLENTLHQARQSCYTQVNHLEAQLEKQQTKNQAMIPRLAALEIDLDEAIHNNTVANDSIASMEAQLLDAQAQQCHTTLLAADNHRLTERIEDMTQTAKQIPDLLRKNHCLTVDIVEKDRHLDQMRITLTELKTTNNKLKHGILEKQQYADSMAQMFADMKKECERLRKERDEKAHHAKQLTEMQNGMELKHRHSVAILESRVEGSSDRAETLKRRLDASETARERSDVHLSQYAQAFARTAELMEFKMPKSGQLPIFTLVESNVSALVQDMRKRKAEVGELRIKTERSQAETEQLMRRVSEGEQLCEILRGKITALEERITDLKTQNESHSCVLEENEALKRNAEKLQERAESLLKEKNRLGAEIGQLQASLSAEREKLLYQLTERTTEFMSVEKELMDARETYRLAAKGFEARRLSLTRRLDASKQRQEEVEQGLLDADRKADDDATRFEDVLQRCKHLEQENNMLKDTADMQRLDVEDGDIVVVREMLAEAEDDRERLCQEVACLKRAQTERRLSWSSISSDEDTARKMLELEATLEEKAREKACKSHELNEVERNADLLKRRVKELEDCAEEKEVESERLRQEMLEIHKRMESDLDSEDKPIDGKPVDSETEMIGESDDDDKFGRKLPAQKRTSRIGNRRKQGEVWMSRAYE